MENLRSELTGANYELSHANSQLSFYKEKNEELVTDLSSANARLKSSQESLARVKSSLERKLSDEYRLRRAAEDDAQLALEIAKENQTVKDESDMWLMRSIEEIDSWKVRCMELERELQGVREELRGAVGNDAKGGEQREGQEEEVARSCLRDREKVRSV